MKIKRKTCPVCESNLLIQRSLLLCGVEAEADVTTGKWTVLKYQDTFGEDVVTCEGGCTEELMQLKLEDLA